MTINSTYCSGPECTYTKGPASSPSAWTRRTLPPNSLRTDGKTPVGFDVDIAKALANMFGLEVVPQTEGTLEALGEDVGVTKEAVAIKKGDSDTAKAVRTALQKLMDDGTYMKILKHWGVENGAIDKRNQSD